MTKEEREKAIDLLDNLIGMVEDNQDNDYDFALKKGIESLREEPCEDAVSRKAIKEMLNARGQCSVMTFDHFIELLYKLPSVEIAQKWIPVSERLPEDGQRVYVTQTFEGGTVAYCTRFPFDKTKGKYIIAWQPLPPNYKGE